MPKCPRKSRKVSKTRCFNDNDVVVHRTPGRCPKGSRKKSKNRCFDDNDNEIHSSPIPEPAFIFQANPANLALQANHANPANLALQANHANPANLALQANQANPVPASAKVRGYMLNHIQRFMGPETSRGYMTGQTFAMLNQDIPSLGRMMFDFLYIGDEPRFKRGCIKYKITENTVVAAIKYQNTLFDLFKDYVRQIYLFNKLNPISLTPQEEVIYKDKLWQMVNLFSMGTPSRENTLLYLEDTTGRVNPKKDFKYFAY
jgi:hypothetical protein